MWKVCKMCFCPYIQSWTSNHSLAHRAPTHSDIATQFQQTPTAGVYVTGTIELLSALPTNAKPAKLAKDCRYRMIFPYSVSEMMYSSRHVLKRAQVMVEHTSWNTSPWPHSHSSLNSFHLWSFSLYHGRLPVMSRTSSDWCPNWYTLAAFHL